MAALEPDFAVIWLNAALMLGLAAWLVFIDFSSRIHRVFALLLFLRGSTFVLGGVARTAIGDGDWATYDYIAAVAPYFHIGFVMCIGYFLMLYPMQRTFVARTSWGAWAWLGATLGIMGWYMVNHAAYGSWVGDEFVSGPIRVLTEGRIVLFGLGALLLARDYHRDPAGSAGYSKFLIFAGFAVAALYDIVDVGFRAYGSWDIVAADPLSWNAAAIVIPVATGPLVLASLAWMAVATRHERADATIQEPRRFLLFVAPLPVLTTCLAIALEGSTSEGALGTFFFGFWRLVFPFLVTYSLLRHQLFEVDVRVKANVARGILLAMFGVTFLLVMEAAEAILSGDAPLGVGMGIAGGLALAAQPLRSLATQAADRFMPDTKPIIQKSPAEREQFYHDQFLLVNDDGRLTPKERTMLDELAFSLRLPEGAPARIELEGPVATDDESNVDAAQLVQSSRLARFVSMVAAVAGFAGFSQFIESFIAVSSFTGGVIAAMMLAPLLGPIEGFVDYLRQPRADRQMRRHRMGSFRHAVKAAWADGAINQRELDYLDRLQAELGLTWADRKKAEARFALRIRRSRVTA